MHPSGNDGFVGKFDDVLVPEVMQVARTSKNPFLMSITHTSGTSRG